MLLPELQRTELGCLRGFAHTSMGDFVDYGKTRDRLERLGNKLEIRKR